MATITIPDDWTPTAANINALPDPLRIYIHKLETHMDPQLTLQQLYECKQQARALSAMVAMLRED
jgi:hypothetical protein